MKRPSHDIEGPALKPLPCSPDELRLTSRVLPFRRSRRNTSWTPFRSCATRFVASELNTTNRPKPEMPTPAKLLLSACSSVELTLTRSVLGPASAGAVSNKQRCRAGEKGGGKVAHGFPP